MADAAAPYQGRHFINGTWCDSVDGKTFDRVSPSHGMVVSRSALGGQIETEMAIKAARTAFEKGTWSRLSGKARAAVLLRVADLIEQNAEPMAQIETYESGKPITQARGEVSGAADLWRYAASLARGVKGDSHNTLGSDMLGVILKEPIGVVSIITPWNFPFWILSQKLPFALAAGCTCVVKPSELTPSTTSMLAELLVQAGLPAGVVNIVLGYGQPVGTLLSSHPDVDMITFTGSTAVGKTISAQASGTLKKVALELGGKNPQVVFADADLDAAADAITFGVYFNAGQCCNSGSRIIAHADIAEALVAKIIALSKKVAFGDPLDPGTQVGALISQQHHDKIDAYVKTAADQGATLRLGGETLIVPGLAGCFYQPTVITDVRPHMAIARDEVFGPVVAVLTFDTAQEAIDLANDATYGLSAGVWSADIHTCLDFARRVQAGTIWTNTWMDGFPEMTFGGMKQSGQGREIGTYGLDEFLEVKTVAMRIGQTRQPWVRHGTPSPTA
jgi:acyl-CoA reductase-like NAD-dependent aldehyde dehydrogenase